MKRADYTHVRVSKKLHAVLKSEAELKNVSISNYISDCVERIQSIEALIANESDVNMAKKHREGLKSRKNGPDAIRTHDLRLVKATS